ncbi:MAG: PadR family transcriptional regulator [Acidobacteriota bacterium]
MSKSPDSTLPMVLLGLVRQAPRSGYDLRRMFILSPMAHYSDSPGSIYPALARLQQKRWIKPVDEPAGSPRRRQRFAITRQGLAALKKWLSKPVTRSDVRYRPGDLMLRFAFLFEVSGRTATIRFLSDFERETSANATSIREYLEENKAHMSAAGRMALEYGLGEYLTRAEWARRALAELRRKRR